MLKNKKGVSDIIATVILIALVMAVTGIVWIVVNNFIKDQTGDAGACFGLFEKVTFNDRYICYDSDSDELQFSINVGDVDVDAILVGVSGKEAGVSFKLKKEPSAVSNVYMYPDHNTMVRSPGPNSGLTYFFDIVEAGLSEEPDVIQISPVIDGKQCEVSDLITEIDNCAILAP
ncbi:MAG: hypothetical protein ABIH65_00665 [Nanoarchaeota archaeon]